MDHEGKIFEFEPIDPKGLEILHDTEQDLGFTENRFVGYKMKFKKF